MSEPIVYYNGKFVPEHEARVPLLTHALQYGTGVFEGIRAYQHRDSGEIHLFRAPDHFERLTRNVKFLQIRLPLSVAEMTDVAKELIRLNIFANDVYIRPVAFKSSTKIGVSLPADDSFAMVAVPMGQYLDTHKGLHCGITTWRRLPDNAIPCRAKICGAYVNSALAAQEARDRGFDEAIFLNEAGSVAEASAMNIFIVRDGTLITPDVTEGILEGITRDTVLRLAKEKGIPSECRAVDRAELYIADEAFLCGTAAEIAPITRIDGRAVGDGRIGSISLDMQTLYNRVVRGLSKKHLSWLMPVYGKLPQPQIRKVAAVV